MSGTPGFDAVRFGSDMRIWLALHQLTLREVAPLVPSGAAQLSRLQRGLAEPKAGLFLAVCHVMGMEPTHYYLKPDEQREQAA